MARYTMARKKCQNLRRFKRESMKKGCLLWGVRAQVECEGDMHRKIGMGKFVIYRHFSQISKPTERVL